MGTKSGSGNNYAAKKATYSWRESLLQTMKDPNAIILEDDLMLVIKDKYPKAAYHYLVLPKVDIKSLKRVKPEHLSLLKHMMKISHQLASRHIGKTFLIGYHAVPSMSRLHLHVISDDFNSPFLKTKKHWNSFTTKFFRPIELVIRQLEYGEIKQLSLMESKELLNTALKCHKCVYSPKNMPDLKRHIQEHIHE